MKLTCPYCGNKYSIGEATRSETLVNLTRALSGFGKWWLLVWEYTGAFATRRLGAIAPPKRLRIVKELAKLWETGIFELERKQYRLTRDKIIESLRTVCDLEKHGFKNHNYLKRVMTEHAERISAEGLTAREERGREDDKKARRSVGQAFQPAEKTMSPEAQAAFKKELGVSSFKELIGKNIKEGSRFKGSKVQSSKAEKQQTSEPLNPEPGTATERSKP